MLCLFCSGLVEDQVIAVQPVPSSGLQLGGLQLCLVPAPFLGPDQVTIPVHQSNEIPTDVNTSRKCHTYPAFSPTEREKEDNQNLFCTYLTCQYVDILPKIIITKEEKITFYGRYHRFLGFFVGFLAGLRIRLDPDLFGPIRNRIRKIFIGSGTYQYFGYVKLYE